MSQQFLYSILIFFQLSSSNISRSVYANHFDLNFPPVFSSFASLCNFTAAVYSLLFLCVTLFELVLSYAIAAEFTKLFSNYSKPTKNAIVRILS